MQDTSSKFFTPQTQCVPRPRQPLCQSHNKMIMSFPTSSPMIVAMMYLLMAFILSSAVHAQSRTWRGLTVAPEERCTAYDRQRDYHYSPSVEHAIVRQIGAVYGPYTGTCFSSMTETDIEHIIALSEAHDSGLCRQSPDIRTRFANDIRNLTLATPHLNRYQKKAKDAAEWLPDRNRCWFAGRIVEVRLAYGLTIDRREANALERILSDCPDTQMEPLICNHSNTEKFRPTVQSDDMNEALSYYDDGRITCRATHRHEIAPVPRSHPAYRYMHDGDGDGDGVVCE